MNVTAGCIFEIHCLVQDSFDLNTVHKLSGKEKKSGQNLAKLGKTGLRTWGCWVESKNASFVLRSPPPPQIKTDTSLSTFAADREEAERRRVRDDHPLGEVRHHRHRGEVHRRGGLSSEETT